MWLVDSYHQRTETFSPCRTSTPSIVNREWNCFLPSPSTDLYRRSMFLTFRRDTKLMSSLKLITVKGNTLCARRSVKGNFSVHCVVAFFFCFSTFCVTETKRTEEERGKRWYDLLHQHFLPEQSSVPSPIFHFHKKERKKETFSIVRKLICLYLHPPRRPLLSAENMFLIIKFCCRFCLIFYEIFLSDFSHLSLLPSHAHHPFIPQSKNHSPPLLPRPPPKKVEQKKSMKSEKPLGVQNWKQNEKLMFIWFHFLPFFGGECAHSTHTHPFALVNICLLSLPSLECSRHGEKLFCYFIVFISKR